LAFEADEKTAKLFAIDVMHVEQVSKQKETSHYTRIIDKVSLLSSTKLN